jgi:hypothetical protein
MGDDLKVVFSRGTSYVSGSSVITPGGNGKPGVDPKENPNYRPYIVPGQDINDATGEVTPKEFVIAWGREPKIVTSSKWWSGALLQHPQNWVIDKGKKEQRSRRMINEPFYIDFVDMEDGYPEKLRQRGVRLWNQSDMYVFAGDQALDNNKNVVLSDNKFTIDNLAQTDAPIVTVGLRGLRPIANPAAGRVSNVFVNDYSEFHVEMAYANEGGGKRDELTIHMASGVPYVVFQRTAGDAPFQLWAGSPVTTLADPSKPHDTYQEWKTASESELGFKLGVRFLPAPPPGVKDPDPPRGVAGYYVRADRGKWIKQSGQDAEYKPQNYYTWINEEASTVWVFAVPHNVSLSNDDEIRAAVAALMAAPAKKFGSAVLYEPDSKGSRVVNGATAEIGYDQENAKITVGYQWSTPPGDKAPEYLALFPHHRKYMRDHDKRCFLTLEDRPRYLYRTLKGEMWLYKGHEFVREFEVHGLLPFLDQRAVGAYPEFYGRVYDALREWFWREEKSPDPNSFSDSFAWNYFSYGGPEANPYMYGWAALWENLTVADQLASVTGTKWGAEQDPDFKAPKWRVAALMRDKILETLKLLVHQWFDVYTAQCLQYNDKYKTMCGYPEGYGCVQKLNDHHYHWGYFLRAAAAIGRHDPLWLERHWPVIQMLVRDSTNYDQKDTEFPLFRNFSAFYGHCWANGIAFNDGQDQESASEALNFAFGMVELATLRADANMLAVGLWLYEEQVCATQQYWFNVDADLDNDPKDYGSADPAYYNGNWPKKFVRFQRNGHIWNNAIISMVKQQSISRTVFFGGQQAPYSIWPARPISIWSAARTGSTARIRPTYKLLILCPGRSRTGFPTRTSSQCGRRSSRRIPTKKTCSLTCTLSSIRAPSERPNA